MNDIKESLFQTLNEVVEKQGLRVINISISGANFQAFFYGPGNTSGNNTWTTTNPAGTTGTGKQHILLHFYSFSNNLGMKATVNGVAGSFLYNNSLGVINPFDSSTRWIALGSHHNHTNPPNRYIGSYEWNLIFFRIHNTEYNSTTATEAYNNREPLFEIMGGSRTFEIEHTKIYEHEYNTQSNSVIVGHNEYSRNQFATALDVSGNVDVSGSIVLTGNVTIPGDITVDVLNYNSMNISPPISIDYSDLYRLVYIFA